MREDAQRELVQCVLTCPLDRSRHERGSNASTSPVARDQHRDLARTEERADPKPTNDLGSAHAAQYSTSIGGSAAIPSRSSATLANRTASGYLSFSCAARTANTASGTRRSWQVLSSDARSERQGSLLNARAGEAPSVKAEPNTTQQTRTRDCESVTDRRGQGHVRAEEPRSPRSEHTDE
jgi:hypothetical protein